MQPRRVQRERRRRRYTRKGAFQSGLGLMRAGAELIYDGVSGARVHTFTRDSFMIGSRKSPVHFPDAFPLSVSGKPMIQHTLPNPQPLVGCSSGGLTANDCHRFSLSAKHRCKFGVKWVSCLRSTFACGSFSNQFVYPASPRHRSPLGTTPDLALGRTGNVF